MPAAPGLDLLEHRDVLVAHCRLDLFKEDIPARKFAAHGALMDSPDR
jgi:hypothetical protein